MPNFHNNTRIILKYIDLYNRQFVRFSILFTFDEYFLFFSFVWRYIRCHVSGELYLFFHR